jgi:hypothetical protein
MLKKQYKTTSYAKTPIFTELTICCGLATEKEAQAVPLLFVFACAAPVPLIKT